MPVRPIVSLITSEGKVGVQLGKIAKLLLENSTESKLSLFHRFLKGKKVLDIGVGTGEMYKLLKKEGYILEGIDVDNTSLYSDVVPVIYDGEKIPLKAKSQDTGLLICVLHHCGYPMKVLSEAMRVCKRLIIIEDTYRNEFEKFLVSLRDMVGNFEFYEHKYKKVNEWKRVFKEHGWKVINEKQWSSVTFYGMYGRQVLFVIEK